MITWQPYALIFIHCYVHGCRKHERKGKGKEEYLYSAFNILCRPISQSAQAWYFTQSSTFPHSLTTNCWRNDADSQPKCVI